MLYIIIHNITFVDLSVDREFRKLEKLSSILRQVKSYNSVRLENRWEIMFTIYSYLTLIVIIQYSRSFCCLFPSRQLINFPLLKTKFSQKRCCLCKLAFCTFQLRLKIHLEKCSWLVLQPAEVNRFNQSASSIQSHQKLA